MNLPAELRPIEPASSQDRGIDVLVGAGASLLIVLFAMLTGSPGTALGLLLVWPLVFRRTSPQLMLLLCFSGAFVQLLLSYPTPGLAVIPVAVYAVARWTVGLWGRLALVTGLLGAVLGPARWFVSDGPVPLAFAVGIVCAAMVLTPYVIGRRRAEGSEAMRRESLAEARTLSLKMTEAEQRARVAEAEERQRIARELHDIIAHSLSVIVVQSEGGRAVAAKRPEQAVETLGTISEISRHALQEMRQLMGVLRNDSLAPADYAPPPGLADIEALVDRVHDRANFTVRGQVPEHVEQTLALAVYRIVQEALTNVLRHAGPKARAEVLLDCSNPHQIRVQITDDGRGADAPTDGHGNGLKGMYERVHLFGGRLITEPKPSGGFLVRAVLPLPIAPGTPAGHHPTTRIVPVPGEQP